MGHFSGIAAAASAGQAKDRAALTHSWDTTSGRGDANSDREPIPRANVREIREFVEAYQPARSGRPPIPSLPLDMRNFFRSLVLVLTATLAVHANAAVPLAKFEPDHGCYIGAFIEKDSIAQGNIPVFEELTKKKHASYFTYVGYGMPFPMAWVEKVKGQDAAPQIAFEPNNGLQEVTDSPYLRDWARDAARARCPIFLRWASEMNGPWTRYGGNPQLYIEKFRLVSRIMKEEAPNVAMVWTVFAEPHDTVPLYYPGDDYVDWVGVNIYSVYVHNGNPKLPSADEDPVSFLKTVYTLYGDRKPIHVSEYAATIYCKGSAKETVQWAIGKMTRFYTALRLEYPRVKSVNWFCLDTINAGLANNNYSLLVDGRVLAAYRQIVSDRYFLSRVDYDPADWSESIPPGTTLGEGGPAFRLTGSDELLTISGAVAATIKEPWLRGLKNGDVVTGDLELTAQMPLGLEAAAIFWRVDGRTVALTNTTPYRVTVPRARFLPGDHTAGIVVLDRNGLEHPSPDVTFTILPDPASGAGAAEGQPRFTAPDLVHPGDPMLPSPIQ